MSLSARPASIRPTARHTSAASLPSRSARSWSFSFADLRSRPGPPRRTWRQSVRCGTRAPPHPSRRPAPPLPRSAAERSIPKLRVPDHRAGTIPGRRYRRSRGFCYRGPCPRASPSRTKMTLRMRPNFRSAAAVGWELRGPRVRGRFLTDSLRIRSLRSNLVENPPAGCPRPHHPRTERSPLPGPGHKARLALGRGRAPARPLAPGSRDQGRSAPAAARSPARRGCAR